MIRQTTLHSIVKSEQPIIRRRKPLRLKEYDYSLAGTYFVAICTKDRIHLFGEIINGEMQCNNIGEIAEQSWKKLPQHFSNIMLDEFVVMPNHVHGVIILNEQDCRDVQLNIPTGNYFSRISPKRQSLGVIVRTYKSAVTTICRQNGYVDFKWQHGYFDHIIRNEKASQRIREYIYNNPAMWGIDKENLEREGNNGFDKWISTEGKHHTLTKQKRSVSRQV